MRSIISDLLWIGNAGDYRNPKLCFSAGIEAIVDLAIEELPQIQQRNWIVCRIPLIDGCGNPQTSLKLAIQNVYQLIIDKVPTLVACGAGMSRSVAIVAAAWALIRNESPESLLIEICRNQPHDVHPALWNDIRGCINDTLNDH